MTITNRPIGLTDSNYAVNPEFFSEEAFQGDYSGGMNLIYKGFAKPGASTALPIWQIAKLTYDGNNNVTMIQWPLRKLDNTDAASVNTSAASNDYEFCWTLRTSYTYQ